MNNPAPIILFVYNPGHLPDNISIEQLLNGEYSSDARNKKVAAIFKEAGVIEKYGSGISRIIEAFKVYNLKAPVFENFQSGFRITVFAETANVVAIDASGELNDELNGELNKRQILVYNKIKEQPNINATELSKTLNIPFSTIDKYIRVFLNKKIIERRGSKKTGGYFIKK